MSKKRTKEQLIKGEYFFNNIKPKIKYKIIEYKSFVKIIKDGSQFSYDYYPFVERLAKFKDRKIVKWYDLKIEDFKNKFC